MTLISSNIPTHGYSALQDSFTSPPIAAFCLFCFRCLKKMQMRHISINWSGANKQGCSVTSGWGGGWGGRYKQNKPVWPLNKKILTSFPLMQTQSVSFPDLCWIKTVFCLQMKTSWIWALLYNMVFRWVFLAGWRPRTRWREESPVVPEDWVPLLDLTPDISW